jgi:hypothetical protein
MKQQPVEACNVKIASPAVNCTDRKGEFAVNFLVLPDCTGRIA